jgi:hypothetical protein
MDIETFWAFTGIYVLLIFILIRHWVTGKRALDLQKKVYESSVTNKEVLESIKLIQSYVLEKVYKEDEKKS